MDAGVTLWHANTAGFGFVRFKRDQPISDPDNALRCARVVAKNVAHAHHEILQVSRHDCRFGDEFPST